MRKRDIKKELQEYPCYLFENGNLTRIPTPDRWDEYELHHFITTQWEQTHPVEFMSVAHLQKLIFMKSQTHIDLHNRIGKFKEKYGIEIDKLLFDWRTYMISAKKARENTDQNYIKIRIANIEKAIKSAVEKGKCEIFTMGELEKEVIEELEKAGFEYEKQVNGYKIRW